MFRVLTTLMAIATSSCSGGAGNVAPAAPGDAVLPSLRFARATTAPFELTEKPAQADSFIDSIGMNTHFGHGGFWTSSFPTLKADLISLGVRHIRDGLSAPADPAIASEFAQLGSAGIHLDDITAIGQSASFLNSIPAAVAPALEAYESPNEEDGAGDPNWVADLTAYQKSLYAAVKRYGPTASMPVIGPSLVSQVDEMSLGNLGAFMDYGNIHNYFAGFNPGTIGWGGTLAGCGPYGYGSIDFSLACESNDSGGLTFTPSPALSGFSSAAPQTGAKAVMSTETGYGTSPASQTQVDATTQAKYESRMFLMQYAAGVPRTYQYDLADDSNPCAAAFSCFGVVKAAGSATKPAYSELHGLISALSDPGASFTTTNLSYTLSGGPASLAHVLFQKRSGQYILALWNETPSWNVNAGTGAPIPVAAQPVSIQLPSTPKGLSAKAFNDSGNLAVVAPTVAGATVTLPIDDHVTLVSFSQ